jgi:hypothetical protein
MQRSCVAAPTRFRHCFRLEPEAGAIPQEDHALHAQKRVKINRRGAPFAARTDCYGPRVSAHTVMSEGSTLSAGMSGSTPAAIRSAFARDTSPE